MNQSWLVAAKCEAQIADEFKHPTGDHRGSHLNEICARTGEVTIDRAIEDLEPPVEVLRQQWRSSVQKAMDLERVAAMLGVVTGSEEHRLPKIAYYGEMVIEVELCNVSKNVANGLVGHCLVVKIDHERVDILSVLNVSHLLVRVLCCERGPQSRSLAQVVLIR